MIDLDEKKRNFYKMMFLECVCDTDRKEFLKDQAQEGLTEFRKKILDKPYDELLGSFSKMMNAEKAIIFQERDGKPLTKAKNGRSINVLSRSKESSNQIGILRSELLHFYCSPFREDWTGPVSSLLLDIKDTVRVVAVAETQKDPMVCEYTRDACVISYIQLNYTDQLTSKTKHIYFAFFYEVSQKGDMIGLLESIRRFLAFRYDLKLRIEKDLNGNLLGKIAEAAWCNDWLSIEKAGAHTDSSEISRLLAEADFDSRNIMDIMCSADRGKENGDKNVNAKKIIYRFIYNVNISMYYRAAISQSDSGSFAVDNIVKTGSGDKERYYLIEDVLRFSPVGEDKILYGIGDRSDNSVLDAINKSVLFGNTSTPENERNKLTGGIPRRKALTIQRRYLQAFLMDILHNIEKHGKKGCPARIYLERNQNNRGYLVFCNEVSTDGKGNLEHWCLAENYTLKQAAEFDHSKHQKSQKGMSLGCIAHCMNNYGNMVVRYKCKDDRVFFEIKLPIIQYEEEI